MKRSLPAGVRRANLARTLAHRGIAPDSRETVESFMVFLNSGPEDRKPGASAGLGCTARPRGLVQTICTWTEAQHLQSASAGPPPAPAALRFEQPRHTLR